MESVSEENYTINPHHSRNIKQRNPSGSKKNGRVGVIMEVKGNNLQAEEDTKAFKISSFQERICGKFKVITPYLQTSTREIWEKSEKRRRQHFLYLFPHNRLSAYSQT